MENTTTGGVSHVSPAGSAAGRGEAADGQVQATATRGRLESLELNPRLMRLSGEQLALYVAAAVDMALEEARAQPAPATDVPPVDPTVLAARLSEVQEEGLRSMQMITQALGEAVTVLRERTGMNGDVGPQGLPELLEQTHRTVEQMTRPAGEDGGPAEDGAVDHADVAAATAKDDDVTGKGEAADGLVHVVAAAPDGRMTTLEIGDQAMGMPSHELAAQVILAINAALADLRAKLREQAGISLVDPERLTALREASTQQMTAYARSLRDLVAGIKPG